MKKSSARDWIINGLCLIVIIGFAVWGFLYVHSEMPTNEKPQEQTAPAPLAEITVVCFGDSLTGNRPGEKYQQHYLKYADLLGLMHQAHLGHDQVAMINSGWAGDRTTPKPSEKWPGAVGRAKADILDHQPDIVTILIGGNNRPETPEAVEALTEDLTKIATQAKSAGIKVLLMTYPPAMPGEAHADQGWPLDLANPAIRATAEKLDLPLLELGPPMAAAAEQQGRSMLVNDKDGVHLKPAGEIVFAKAIFAKLKSLGWLNAETTPQP